MQHSASGENNRSSVKKLPEFSELNVHYRIDNSPLFCLNPVHASSYNLILFYHLHFRLPSGLFPSGVHTKTLRDSCKTYVLYAPPI